MLPKDWPDELRALANALTRLHSLKELSRACGIIVTAAFLKTMIQTKVLVEDNTLVFPIRVGNTLVTYTFFVFVEGDDEWTVNGRQWFLTPYNRKQYRRKFLNGQKKNSLITRAMFVQPRLNIVELGQRTGTVRIGDHEETLVRFHDVEEYVRYSSDMVGDSEFAQLIAHRVSFYEYNPPEAKWAGTLEFEFDPETELVVNCETDGLVPFMYEGEPNREHVGKILMTKNGPTFEVVAIMAGDDSRLRTSVLVETEDLWAFTRRVLKFFHAEEVFLFLFGEGGAEAQFLHIQSIPVVKEDLPIRRQRSRLQDGVLYADEVNRRIHAVVRDTKGQIRDIVLASAMTANAYEALVREYLPAEEDPSVILGRMRDSFLNAMEELEDFDM